MAIPEELAAPSEVFRLTETLPVKVNMAEKNPDIKIPTTKGIIRYSKNGAHIVPSNPNGH